MTELKNISGFQQTKEMARVTLNGWDGKSYEGEGRNLRVWINPAHPDKKFVRVDFREKGCKGAICFHEITEEKHPVSGVVKAEYFCSIDK